MKKNLKTKNLKVMENLLKSKQIIEDVHSGRNKPDELYFKTQTEVGGYVNANLLKYKGFIPINSFIEGAVKQMVESYGDLMKKGTHDLYFAHALRVAGLVNYHNKNKRRSDTRVITAMLHESMAINYQNRKGGLGMEKLTDLFGLDVSSNVSILSENHHGWLNSYKTILSLAKKNVEGDILLVSGCDILDTLKQDLFGFKMMGKKYFKFLPPVSPEKRLFVFGEIGMLAQSSRKTKGLGKEIINALSEFSRASGVVPG